MDFVKAAGGGAIWHIRDQRTGATLCGQPMIGHVDEQAHDTKSAICTCPACQRARAATLENSTPPAELPTTAPTPIEIDLKINDIGAATEPALHVAAKADMSVAAGEGNAKNLDESLSAGRHIDIEV